MPLSGKTAVALADYYETHFEWTYFGDGKGTQRVVCVDELRDFFIEGEYNDVVVEWARRIPRAPGQIREHILATRKNTPLMTRFAQDVLNRPAPQGRHVDTRIRARLVAALLEDGYTLVGGKLVGSPEAMARDAQDDASGTASPSPSTAGASKAAVHLLTERECMVRTVELARKCVSEDASKITPKVAALVVRDGLVLGDAFRGELGPGEHAEYTLLKKKLDTPEVQLAGATLFTTLEPCNSRNEPKVPCAERVVDRKIGRVFIGTLDPNPVVSGKGVQRLRDASIEIRMYDADLMTQLEELNEEFYRQQRRK
jgi:pyrimidine deaminase RibD-like protein